MDQQTKGINSCNMHSHTNTNRSQNNSSYGITLDKQTIFSEALTDEDMEFNRIANIFYNVNLIQKTYKALKHLKRLGNLPRQSAEKPGSRGDIYELTFDEAIKQGVSRASELGNMGILNLDSIEESLHQFESISKSGMSPLLLRNRKNGSTQLPHSISGPSIKQLTPVDSSQLPCLVKIESNNLLPEESSAEKSSRLKSAKRASNSYSRLKTSLNEINVILGVQKIKAACEKVEQKVVAMGFRHVTTYSEGRKFEEGIRQAEMVSRSLANDSIVLNQNIEDMAKKCIDARINHGF